MTHAVSSRAGGEEREPTRRARPDRAWTRCDAYVYRSIRAVAGCRSLPQVVGISSTRQPMYFYVSLRCAGSCRPTGTGLP